MTPEEKVNQYTWSVLQDLKNEILLATSKSIEFELTSVAGAGILSKGTQIKIIHKLEEQKAIKILESHEPNWQEPRGWFKLLILQPKFDEIYKTYQEACDPQAHLNAYQNAILNNDELPKFLQAESNNDKLKESLVPLSQKSKDRILIVVNKLIELAEITSKDDPIYFEPVAYIGSDNQYNESTIIAKLRDFEVLEWDVDDITGNLFIHTSIDRLNRIKIILEEQLASNQPEVVGKNIEVSNQKLPSKVFVWNIDRECTLPNGKCVKFGSVTSSRIKIFKMLINTPNDWVKVSDMARAIQKTDKIVRTTIGQINAKNLNDTGFIIIPRRDTGEPGAYKITKIQQ